MPNPARGARQSSLSAVGKMFAEAEPLDVRARLSAESKLCVECLYITGTVAVDIL